MYLIVPRQLIALVQLLTSKLTVEIHNQSIPSEKSVPCFNKEPGLSISNNDIGVNIHYSFATAIDK